MINHGLLVRLAVVMIVSSLSVGFVSANLFSRLTYLNEVEIANKGITQLYQTVSSTASVAAYLEDTELAKEVVNGLSTNAIVLGSSIQIGDVVVSSSLTSSTKPLVFDLMSPFEKDRVVGTLTITPNLEHIQARAQKIGKDNATALVMQALIVTLISILIAYFLITRPMINIAEELHTTVPGTSKRLLVPDFHRSSELGILVGDINDLLHNTERQISDERVLRQELEVLEKRFRMLFENSISPIVLMEPEGDILLYNDAFGSLLGSIGIKFKANFGPLLADLLEEPEQFVRSVKASIANAEVATGEYKLLERGGREHIWLQIVVTSILSDDMKEYYHITLHDISKRKKELESLNHQANFDQLTQLPNRHAAEREILENIASNTAFVIILMDLNGFKEVNDLHGHEAGDEILIYVANQLKHCVRRDDLACRWGGDEFVLVFPQMDREGAQRMADKLLASISKPYSLSQSQQEVSVGGSLGASFYPEDESSLQNLIHLADQAMYAAKRMRKSGTPVNLVFAGEHEEGA